jgi:hypothetical protein
MMLNNIFSSIKVSSANIKNYSFDGKQWTTPNEQIKTQSKYEIDVEDQFGESKIVEQLANQEKSSKLLQILA